MPIQSPRLSKSPDHSKNQTRKANQPKPQAVIQNQSGGHRLPVAFKRSMETTLDTNLDQVSVHTDTKAVQMSRQLDAQAFSYGNNIYFDEGNYKPDTQEGKHLLAHELTHVKQQKGIPPIIQRKPNVKPQPITLRPKNQKERMEWRKLWYQKAKAYRPGISKGAFTDELIARAMTTMGGNRVKNSFFMGSSYEKVVAIKYPRGLGKAYLNTTDYNCHNHTFFFKNWTNESRLKGIEKTFKVGKRAY